MASSKNQDLMTAACAIVADLQGPAGQIALDRVVRHHLPFFQNAQDRGLSWPQIARLLHAKGAGRENGQPFSHSHLSAVVWRQRTKAEGQSTVHEPVASEVSKEPLRKVVPGSGALRKKRVMKADITMPPKSRGATVPHVREHARDVQSLETGVAAKPLKPKPYDVDSVRETMRRAMAARKRGNDS